MPASSTALYFQGNARVLGGAGSAFGDGLRCVTGTIARLGVKLNSTLGASQFPGVGDPPISVQGNITTPGIRYYQIWFRNAAAFCTPSAFNMTNAVEIAWS
jgi:hypothetical protein